MSKWAAGRQKIPVYEVCNAGSAHAGELRSWETTQSDYDLQYPKSNYCDERETKIKIKSNAHVYANHEIPSLTTSTILDQPF